MVGQPKNCKVLMVMLSLLMWLCIATAASGQTTLYVNGTCGDDLWTGTNPVCQAPDGPKRSIQPAMNQAQTGDTVLVADGTYTGVGNGGLFFPGGQNFILRSENGPEACIIDAGNTGLAFWFVIDETPDAVIRGFTITNGNNDFGGAIYCHHSGKPTFIDCIISNNRANFGGAVACDDEGSPTFINCTFANNSATVDGGVVYIATDDTGPSFINCTIVDNEVPKDGTAITIFGGLATITNSIVWGNSGEQISGGIAASVTFSDVQGGFTGEGNIDADPLFVDRSTGDYHITAGSPVIDSADNTSVPNGIKTDLDSNPRFHDDPCTIDTGNGDPPVVDMGAYEFQESSGCLAQLTGFDVVTGEVLEGDLPDLFDSDDSYIHTRSGFGSTFVDLHNMEMIISAVTIVDGESTIDLTIESRINEPVGLAQIRLRNWNTNQFEQVASYSIGNTDQVETINNIDATNYVDGANEIDLSIKHLVFVPFLAFTFESFIDQVEIVVQ